MGSKTRFTATSGFSEAIWPAVAGGSCGNASVIGSGDGAAAGTGAFIAMPSGAGGPDFGELTA